MRDDIDRMVAQLARTLETMVRSKVIADGSALPGMVDDQGDGLVEYVGRLFDIDHDRSAQVVARFNEVMAVAMDKPVAEG